jgi:hypothetical protein
VIKTYPKGFTVHLPGYRPAKACTGLNSGAHFRNLFVPLFSANPA